MNDEQKPIEKTINKTDLRPDAPPVALDPLVIPHRVQRQRTRGWKMPDNTVYVGRPSKWGNPFKIGDGFPYFHSSPLNREDTIKVFESYLESKLLDFTITDVRKELAGKNLACWCPLDKPCHADVLLKIANAVSV